MRTYCPNMTALNNNQRLVTRRKVLIIPYIGENMDKVLMVKDSKTGEWGFISGGVKKRESFYNAAVRELMEETSGLITSIDQNALTNVFYTYYRPQELLKVDNERGEVVRSMYTVFMYELTSPVSLHLFTPNKEVVDVQIKPYAEFSNIWSFCDEIYHNNIYNIFKSKTGLV
jgi:8-oxo-dGTP pyrophosphatase MutT (NUDIX family)